MSFSNHCTVEVEFSLVFFFLPTEKNPAMKICLTVNSSPWSKFKGGGQIAVHHLASAISRKGHEVHVLYSKCPGEPVTPPDVNYKIHWVRHYNFATLNLNIFSFAQTLSPLAARENFDIIHGNAEEAFFAAGICRKTNAACFFTSHAPFIPRTGIAGALVNPIFLLKRLNAYLLRAAANNAEQIITFSNFSKNLMTDGLGPESQNKVHVILPGIDPTWADVTRDPQPNDQLVFWGRMEDEKGIPELLQAFSKVTQRHPEIQLHLAGEGNRYNAYKQQTRKLGLAGNTVFHGWLDTAGIQRLAAKSLAGIFPSRIESFGLATAEAQAAGLPVICTNAGALPETVQDGINGTVVPTGDVEQLSDAMLSLLADATQHEEMARNTRQPGKYSWDNTAEKLLALYATVRKKI